MIKNLVIGSSFSALGCVLALIKKKENATVILGHYPREIKKSNNIKLPTRNFYKYQNNINTSFYINKFVIDKKYNFISYLGPGGLSNLWGKVINTNVNFDPKIINFLLKRIKIKKNEKVKFNKFLNLYKFNNLILSPLKILQRFKKKIKLIKNVYVVKINYDEKNYFFKVLLSNNKIITCKKLYLSSGIFSTISLINNFFGKNFKKKNIDLLYNNLIYGFLFFKKKYFLYIFNKNEYYYFDNSYKLFCGRVSILNNNIIKKYNLSYFFVITYFLFNIIGFRILLLSLMYKRKSKSTKIIIKNRNFFIESKKENPNRRIENIAKNLLARYFKSNFYFPFKTKIGSDFHYSSNILKNINFTKFKRLNLKNLFILDSSFSIKTPFFPAFYFIINSYFRVINNINILRLKK